MNRLLSPRQAATLIGRSESTVRRWCDRREVSFKQTPGGHRRLLESSVLAHARTLGLLEGATSNGASGQDAGAHATSSELCTTLTRHLVDGELSAGRRLLVDLFKGSVATAEVCDSVIAPAMGRIGSLWASGRLAIYEEHAATQAVAAGIVTASHEMPLTGDAVAVCAALSGDPYALGPLMTGLILQSEGFRPLQLGADTPIDEILRAANKRSAALVTLSIGSVTDVDATASAINKLSDRLAQRGCKLVVGGRMLTADVRRQLRVDFMGDTLGHLAVYARRLARQPHKDLS